MRIETPSPARTPGKARAGLLAHTSTYTAGNFLVTLAGLITFPLLTRVFTPAEYGLISLISATLLLLVSLGKLGIQHSGLRFYSEVAAHEGAVGLERFHATVLYGTLLAGLTATVAWAAASQLVPSRWWGDPRAAGLFLLTAILVLIRVVESGISNVLRAQERSGAVTLYAVLKRYFSLLLVVLTLVLVARDLRSYYVAVVAAEASAILALLAYVSRRNPYRPGDFSPALFRRMLVFGIPMVGYEATGTMLEIGDRYVINAVLGAGAVGLYAAAYNLCDYVKLVFVASMLQAVQPMYMRIWEERGKAEMQAFLSRALHYYLFAACPIAAGLAAIAPDIISALASDRYRAGAVTVPAIITGILVSGLGAIVGAGLYIRKRSDLIMLLVAGTVVINLLLNLLLVPRVGIEGAAWATLLSYLGLTGALMVVSNRAIRIEFPWWTLLKFSALAAAMYAVVVHLDVRGGWWSLLVKVPVGIVVYGGLVLACDRSSRLLLRQALVRLDAWRTRRLAAGPAP